MIRCRPNSVVLCGPVTRRNSCAVPPPAVRSCSGAVRSCSGAVPPPEQLLKRPDPHQPQPDPMRREAQQAHHEHRVDVPLQYSRCSEHPSKSPLLVPHLWGAVTSHLCRESVARYTPRPPCPHVTHQNSIIGRLPRSPVLRSRSSCHTTFQNRLTLNTRMFTHIVSRKTPENKAEITSTRLKP